MPHVNSVQEQVEAINRMTPSQLTVWIVDCLARRDLLLEDDAENSSSYPLVAITRHLAPVVIEAIHQATAGLVRSWIDDGCLTDAVDLLLLVQGLHVIAVREDLELLARSEQFRQLSAEIQYRVLQTLISLDVNVEPSFWHRAFEVAPERLTGIAFDGLALVSPNHAIDFLSSVPNNSSAIQQVRIALPGFMDDLVPARDRAGIRTLIESRLAEMQPPLAAALTEFFAEEQTPLAVLPLVQTWDVKKAKRNFPISAENFPALASIKHGLDRVFGFESENPAKMFANLAHQ